MRRQLSAAALFLLLAAPARAGSLAGVTLPDTAASGGKTLVLNGLGLRSKFMIKIYVGGLYLEAKSRDAAAIAAADARKRIVMKFLYAPSAKQMRDAFREGFAGNGAPPAAAELEKFLAAVPDIAKRDELAVDYEPGAGTSLIRNGKTLVTVPGAEFARSAFLIWLGPKPPSADLKAGMLGG